MFAAMTPVRLTTILYPGASVQTARCYGNV